jgi:7,8-dihydropterin-6-yl-methyl-4-(beta-D-ribofuranosyl)aminobenzene 5'-phosphate synthase
LIENSPSKTDPHLVAEWGLSLHIAFDGHNILFDTGASGSFAKNAERLSVDVASVEAAVLSHHHYDHGGGLRRFLEINSRAKVHLGEAPDGDCYGRLWGVVNKYADLDKTLLSGFAERFETVHKTVEILPDVFIIPHVDCPHPKPAGNKVLYLKKDGSYRHDDFAHEIVMAIRENGKLVVFTGCSHSGVLNMVDAVTREFKGVPIKAVIGGLHLIAAPPFNFLADSKRDIEALANSVLDYPIEMAYTGHCTSAKAYGVLKGVMGERIAEIRTGSRIEI